MVDKLPTSTVAGILSINRIIMVRDFKHPQLRSSLAPFRSQQRHGAFMSHLVDKTHLQGNITECILTTHRIQGTCIFTCT